LVTLQVIGVVNPHLNPCGC